MIHTDEDDEFERIANEAKLKGQPYYFDAKGESLSRAIGARKKEDDDDIQDYVRPWVGLTDEEQHQLWTKWIESMDGWGSFYRAIEAKLKEKNRG